MKCANKTTEPKKRLNIGANLPLMLMMANLYLPLMLMMANLHLMASGKNLPLMLMMLMMPATMMRMTTAMPMSILLGVRWCAWACQRR